MQPDWLVFLKNLGKQEDIYGTTLTYAPKNRINYTTMEHTRGALKWLISHN
jgi:hypothetical protein